MNHLSRRSLLGAVAAGTTAAAAGCTGGVLEDDDESSGGDAVYGEWLAAEFLADLDTGTVIYADIGEIRDHWPDEAVSELQLESLTTNLGVSAEDLDGMLIFQTGGNERHGRRPDRVVRPGRDRDRHRR